MEENLLFLAKKIQDLTQNNGETDAARLALETNLHYQAVVQAIQKMEALGWISAYEMDMCCGMEYVVNGLTQKGTLQITQN